MTVKTSSSFNRCSPCWPRLLYLDCGAMQGRGIGVSEASTRLSSSLRPSLLQLRALCMDCLLPSSLWTSLWSYWGESEICCLSARSGLGRTDTCCWPCSTWHPEACFSIVQSVDLLYFMLESSSGTMWKAKGSQYWPVSVFLQGLIDFSSLHPHLSREDSLKGLYKWLCAEASPKQSEVYYWLKVHH